MTDNPHNNATLLVAMELSNSKWLLGFGNGQKIRRKSIEARSRSRFLQEVARAKEKLGLDADAPVLCCYEAGRDGFWISRWLQAEEIHCLVIDPASIEVSRRKRRAKTDRIDVESMLRLLGRHHSGEQKLWSVVRVPSREQEDELRSHRELDRLKREKTAHSNRIKSLLILHGIQIKGSLLKLNRALDELRCWDERPLPPSLREEISREYQRYMQVIEQIRLIEKEKNNALQSPRTSSEKKAQALCRLRGIGEVSSWILAKEFFGWRTFRNRKEVASLAGLTPSPYNSGQSEVEQGISKAGNPLIRKTMVELAWSWVRYQPESKLTLWFLDRYARGSSRQRRVGIVALARKLLVALWKYVEQGIVPEGAIIR